MNQDTKKIIKYTGAGLMGLLAILCFTVPYYVSGSTKYFLFSFSSEYGNKWCAFIFLVLGLLTIVFALTDKLQIAAYSACAIAGYLLITWDIAWCLKEHEDTYHMFILYMAPILSIACAAVLITCVLQESGELNMNSIPAPTSINMNSNDEALQYKKTEGLKEAPLASGITDENYDLIKQYKELLDSNIITQEQFNDKKKEILGL